MIDSGHYKDIVSYIESLYSSRHLIAEAYCNSGIDIREDNSRELSVLQQIRVMGINPRKEESLRLTPRITELLDDRVSRFRLMAVASDFVGEVDQLSKLIAGYERSCVENEVEDQERFSDDFDMAAYKISDMIDNMIISVDTMAHNNFTNVRSYKERIIQNKHYTEEMKKLVKATSMLSDPELIKTMSHSLDLQILYIIYSRHILDKMISWRSKMLDIIGYLEEHMADINKQAQPFSRLIRTFSMHMRRHPEYTPRDIEDYPEIPDWAYLHEGIAIKPYPDVSDLSRESDYIKLAKTIQRSESVVRRERKAGVALEDDNLVEHIEIEYSPFEKSLIRLISMATQTQKPISAREYFEKEAEIIPSQAEKSLICLASILDSDNRKRFFKLDKLLITRHDMPEESKNQGNIYIKDFTLCQNS